MLDRARAADATAELVEADAARWRPQAPVDLILANASLQWLGGHERLLPDLLRHCRVLPVQVPDNFNAPSHRLLRETMASGPWAGQLAEIAMGDRILQPERYLAVLRAAGATVDLWRTTYFQQLAGADAVLDWLRGTALLPVQAALGGAEASAGFERALGERLRALGKDVSYAELDSPHGHDAFLKEWDQMTDAIGAFVADRVARPS